MPPIQDQQPRFIGKLAVITGGSQGIGKATAMILAREGAQLNLNGRSLERLRQARDDVANLALLFRAPMSAELAAVPAGTKTTSARKKATPIGRQSRKTQRQPPA